jgi:hypothetical protein
MAKYAWPAGATSKTVLIFLQDSSSTTGAGKTGVTAGAVNVQQIRVLTNNTVEIATVSVTNLAALSDAYLLGGLLEVSSANAPGWYRFDIPDAVLSIGAVTAAISIKGSISAANIAQLALEVQLQRTPADVITWNGTSVSVSYLMPVSVRMWDQTSVSSSNVAVQDFSTRLNVNVGQWAGTSVTNNSIVMRSTSATLLADVLAWNGTAVSTPPAVHATMWGGVSTSASHIAVQDFSTRLNANVQQWAGASVTTNNIVLRSEISLSSVNVTAWAGVSTSASNFALLDVSAVVQANIMQVNSMSITGSGTAGNPWVPD